jgi:hypothetical protein
MNCFAEFRKKLSQNFAKLYHDLKKSSKIFYLEASYGYYDVILNQVSETKLIPDPEWILDLYFLQVN